VRDDADVGWARAEMGCHVRGRNLRDRTEQQHLTLAIVEDLEQGFQVGEVGDEVEGSGLGLVALVWWFAVELSASCGPRPPVREPTMGDGRDPGVEVVACARESLDALDDPDENVGKEVLGVRVTRTSRKVEDGRGDLADEDPPASLVAGLGRTESRREGGLVDHPDT